MIKLHLSEELALSLFTQLENERQTNKTFFWQKNSIIRTEDGRSHILRHDVVCRVRKPGKQGFCYEFVDTSRRFGSGSKNAVYRIVGTLTHGRLKQNVYTSKQGVLKERLIKYQRITVSDPLTLILNEYINASTAGMPGVKRPTICGNMAYLKMNRLPGRDLEKILDEERFYPRKQLSFYRRTLLALALLEALDLQVAQHNIIHRDIKPSNILVEFTADGIPRVYIIDYGFSIRADQLDGLSAGSPGYAAHECMTDACFLQSTATDIFSMGAVFLELFRAEIEVQNHLMLSQQKGQTPDFRLFLSHLFQGIPQPDRELARRVRAILYRMLDPVAECRLSLREAIKETRELVQLALLAQPLAASSAESSAATSEARPILPPPSRTLPPPSIFDLNRLRFFSEQFCPRRHGGDSQSAILSMSKRAF